MYISCCYYIQESAGLMKDEEIIKCKTLTNNIQPIQNTSHY